MKNRKLNYIKNVFDSMEIANYFHTVFDINNFNNILKNGLALKENNQENNQTFYYNLKKYNKFNNCSLKHFFALIKDTPLSKKMEFEISKKYNQKIPYSLIVNYVENDYICNNACTNWLKDIMKYMRDNPLYTKKYCGFGNINEIKDIKELYTYNDSIGQVVKINRQLDFDTRDNGWIYIKPNIYLETKQKESHTKCLLRWCDNNHIDFISDKRQVRLDKNELKDINIHSCAFGHKVNQLAFIETMQGISLYKLINKLKDVGYKKIYLYNNKNRFVKRIV